MTLIAWLDAEHENPAELGGKGASLAALRWAGFDVPPGFCVRADGYRRFVAANNLAAPIEALLADLARAQQQAAGLDPRAARVALMTSMRQACEALSPHVEKAGLPASLAAQIRDAYAMLRGHVGAQLVAAARSSALSEDASGASSAGLYETYLNLRDEGAVLDAVLRCYQSLWTPRAVQYRAVKHIDSAREAMAVVVMEMVPSDVSGVAFTVNPVTGDRNQITINASWGLGEAIVSGRVTPDQFLLDKSSLAIIEREISAKDVETRPDPSGASGTVTLDVPPLRSQTPALTDEQVRALGDVCLRIERQYGRPMDVEWAFAHGRLYVLQARPVTGLA